MIFLLIIINILKPFWLICRHFRLPSYQFKAITFLAQAILAQAVTILAQVLFKSSLFLAQSRQIFGAVACSSRSWRADGGKEANGVKQKMHRPNGLNKKDASTPIGFLYTISLAAIVCQRPHAPALNGS